MKRAFNLIGLWPALCGQISAAPAFLEQTALWTAGQDGYHTYRIPALIVSAKGTILAFCEGRKLGRGDSGDISCRLFAKVISKTQSGRFVLAG